MSKQLELLLVYVSLSMFLQVSCTNCSAESIFFGSDSNAIYIPFDASRLSPEMVFLCLKLDFFPLPVIIMT